MYLHKNNKLIHYESGNKTKLKYFIVKPKIRTVRIGLGRFRLVR